LNSTIRIMFKNDVTVAPLQEELFTQARGRWAPSRSITHIIYGVERRRSRATTGPGSGAAKLHDVKAPLVEADFYKSEIRELAREAGFEGLGSAGVGMLEFAIPLRNGSDSGSA